MYLKTHHPECKQVYAFGSRCLAHELQEAGFSVISSQDHNEKYNTFDYHQSKNFKVTEHVDAVVQGYDDKINLYKIWVSSFYVQKGAVYLSTNPDLNTLASNGLRIPGNGCLVRTVENSCGIKSVCTGKPNPFCFDDLVKKQGIQKDKVLFVGDNLKTDIKFANGAGVDSFLVMTGVTTSKRLAAGALEGDGQPTYIGENLSPN
jgi:4-nitrophenyl phosphatase